ncbi:hypothetical protein [Nocardioides sp.]|uniref:hypothetical protein n=1 Tax=Nocardioides sp. TaxID=35761 RepID=UPI003516C06B
MTPRLDDLDLRLRAALEATSRLDDVERALGVALCRDIVSMVPDLGLPHRGRTARDAVHLLVGTALPQLDPRLRGELARLCEVAVVRGR